MRKIRIVPALLALGALALAACGSETDTAGTEETQSAAAEEAPAVIAVEDGTETEQNDTSAYADASIEETVLYDADGITVTAIGFHADGAYGPAVQIRTHNDSDMTVEISADDVAVNGYMMEPGLFYSVVEPGSTDTSELLLYDFSLNARGIDTVAEISLSVSVWEEEEYEKIGTGERITLTTSAAEGYVQPVDDSGEEIWEDDGVRVVSKGLMEDELWDGDLVFYVENDTDRYLAVSAVDVSVNGVSEEDLSFWADLQPDTRTVGGMYLMNLEDPVIRSIDDVETISFRLQIIDQDAWERIGESDEITLRFE